jgi:hypothetical protein
MPNHQPASRPAMTMIWLKIPVSFWPNAVAEQAVDDPQHRAGERRHRDHQPLLRWVEPELLRDDRRERSEHDPDHERDVEVQKRGEQRRRVPRLPECLARRPLGHLCGYGYGHRRSPFAGGQHEKAASTWSWDQIGGFVATLMVIESEA